MRIVQITPGSGDNFYCENCMRDNMLVRALSRLGHDALLVPLYLPPRMEETGKGRSVPIFFGGINVFLQQKFSLFRKTPRWIDRLFDAPFFLNWAARKAGMTSAKDLGETTLSMLEGEEGRQVKELDRLTGWLGEALRPDVVILSNALLTGLARRIKERLSCAVVCLLQDEDDFLDSLAEPYREQAWRLLAERAKDVDRFAAVSKYYASVMLKRLNLPEDRIQVVYTGIPVDGYETAAPPPEGVIGFLSRQCHGKGLDLLAEAFLLLKKKERFKKTKLRITGGKTTNDAPFIREVRNRLDAAGVSGDVEFLDGFDEARRRAFLRTLSVLAVPERHGEAWGFYVLEALASGVPVVQPANGVFPELLELTGGGILHEPGNTGALAEALEGLLDDPDRARDLGMKGRRVVQKKFNMENTAKDLAKLCEQSLES